MYLRLLQLKVKPKAQKAIEQIYQTKVLKALRRIPGCLSASLIQSCVQKGHWISMTMWDSRENAEKYEKNPISKELVAEIYPHLSESSEWKIQLDESYQLQYQPTPEEPIIKSYSLVTKKDLKPALNEVDRLCTRIVSLKLQPGKEDEFRRIYQETIIPALIKTEGCLYAYLMEGTKDSQEVISVTIWSNPQDAEKYEKSGKFNQLVEQVKHTFSKLMQWKMSLEKNRDSRIRTSDDMVVDFYTNVSGSQFMKD